MFNPFPGLRPFEPDEDNLFFGREPQIDEILRCLRLHRFLAIMGASGCGKSSLVRSGMIPALGAGSMVGTGPDWRIAIMRPGEKPMRNLAAALNSQGVFATTGELKTTKAVMLETTLRRGTRGLVEAVRQERLAPGENLLIVVDQFEELFRFRRISASVNSSDEAIEFVKVLIEAAAQQQVSIYIVITMRSDFIGDCMDFTGLPEVINAGLYLVPRMTREQLRSAITGPVAVGGGKITQRLVFRLLNDLGDEYEQLPLLQHALMRSWDHWRRKSPPTDAIDLDDYEEIGTLRRALSLHAEEAYEETGTDDRKKAAEKIFKALTDTFSDSRGTRRPTSLRDLSAICQATEADVLDIIEIFRRPGRSFLMPPANVPLDANCIIDLSHESLMRCWQRLTEWAEQERVSAEMYARLTDAAKWFDEGTAGLWRNPELEVGLRWSRENRPNIAWAQRFNSSFAQAMAFLERSEAEKERLEAEKRRERQRKLRQTQWAAGVLGSLFVVALFLAYLAWKQTQRAEANLQLGKKAVDESLSSAGRQQAREFGDMPEVEQFRKELLTKAEAFYVLFARENSADAGFGADEARAHSRLGDINRLTGDHEEAARQYELAISSFETLAKAHPHNPDYRESLAYAHNWLGETIRDALDKLPGFGQYNRTKAADEYTSAIALQEALCSESPTNDTYKQELARTYYNRGIIHSQMGDGDGAQVDFRRAIGLLEPLAAHEIVRKDASSDPDPAEDLARAYNDYANTQNTSGQMNKAESWYDKAVALAQKLVKQQPDNREYKIELSTYSGNEARMLASADQTEKAGSLSELSLQMLEDLTEPQPGLVLSMVQALQLKGQLVGSQDPHQALVLTNRSFSMIQRLVQGNAGDRSRLSDTYMEIGTNYCELADQSPGIGGKAIGVRALAGLKKVLPYLSVADNNMLSEHYRESKARLSKHSSKR